MGNPKYAVFFALLNSTLNSLDPIEVKLALGDSINNNRTLTVNQVIRFLTQAGTRRQVKLGNNLLNIFSILKDDIRANRGNLRTDALDINEFLNFYETVVIGGGEFRNTIGRNVTIAA